MMGPTRFIVAGASQPLASLPVPVTPAVLLPGSGEWEVEVGFGKGRYLRDRAAAEPERLFLGIEMVSKYARLLADRAARRGLRNLVVVHGEALYLLAAVMPRGFATTLHIYFPDPWPKSRHHKRRLFDPETVDLVLGVLRPGGTLFFATDFLDYGAQVQEILAAYPGLDLATHPGPWPDGARTNYEAKYEAEGRPILRLVGRLSEEACPGALHPQGKRGILAATAPHEPAATPAAVQPVPG